MAERKSRIDLHMHTTVSDGTDTPEQIIENVRAAGIDIFSVTDHDAVKTGKIIRGLLGGDPPRFITGAEFSCRDDEGKYHILGYGFDPDADSMHAIVELGHSFRVKKVRDRIDFLKSEFGFSFTDDELAELFALDNPGKPHIGNLMVKHGYAESKKQAISDFIDRIRFKSEYVRPEQAISAILAGGGIPVLAHPFFGSGDELILGDEMERRLTRLTGFGLRGIEAFYSGFSDKLRREAIALSERYGLYVTAGSDYHGSNKLISLGDTGLDGEAEYPVGLRRFLEIVLNEAL